MKRTSKRISKRQKISGPDILPPRKCVYVCGIRTHMCTHSTSGFSACTHMLTNIHFQERIHRAPYDIHMYPRIIHSGLRSLWWVCTQAHIHLRDPGHADPRTETGRPPPQGWMLPFGVTHTFLYTYQSGGSSTHRSTLRPAHTCTGARQSDTGTQECRDSSGLQQAPESPARAWARALPTPEMFAHAHTSRDLAMALVMSGQWALVNIPAYRHTLTLLVGPAHTHTHACWGCSALTQHTRACTNPPPTPRPRPPGSSHRQTALTAGCGGGQPKAWVARDTDVGLPKLHSPPRQRKKASDHS